MTRGVKGSKASPFLDAATETGNEEHSENGGPRLTRSGTASERRGDGRTRTLFVIPVRQVFLLPSDYVAAKRRHSPGTPFKIRAPQSAKSMPDPAARSFTVLETNTSPGRALATTRAPM